MESSEYTGGKLAVIRVDDGEDLISSIKKGCAEQGVTSGIVLSLIGAVSEVEVINPGGSGEKPEPIITRLCESMEVLGSGNISFLSDGQVSVHIHVSLGSKNQESFTGHLVSGKVKYFAEIFIQEIHPQLYREKIKDWEFQILKP